jgi:membrane protein implicated in regulation of membrane protease activity
MDPWLIWLIVAVVLAIAEVLSLTAALGMLSIAALVTSGVAAIGVPVPGQLVAFTVVSVAGVVLVRPWARKQLLQIRPERFGIDALVGRSAYVLQDVSGHAGLVRIGGEEWSARPIDDSVVITAGSTVDVLRIDGSVAIVYPRE